MGWAIAVAVSGSLAIWGRHPGRLAVHWTFKPVTVLLIVIATLAHPSTLGPVGRAGIVVALLLSLAGDLALMPPWRAFALGLASFLAAHLTYVAVFVAESGLRASQLGWLVVPAAAAVLVVRGLWPGLGRLRPAVVLYVAALTALSWRLLARYDVVSQIGLGAWALGALGGALFLVSDTLLARRRFAGAEAPYLLELGSYFAAQYLIASSTWLT